MNGRQCLLALLVIHLQFSSHINNTCSNSGTTSFRCLLVVVICRVTVVVLSPAGRIIDTGVWLECLVSSRQVVTSQ